MSEYEQPRASLVAVRFPVGENELKDRLREAIGDESQASFARRAGVAESVFRKYLAGAQPSTDRLVAMADAAGVNVLWLAAGRGPKKGAAPVQAQQQTTSAPSAPLDMERLARAVAAVQEGLAAIGRTLPPSKYAELVAAAYELLDSPSSSASNVIRFIKAAA